MSTLVYILMFFLIVPTWSQSRVETAWQDRSSEDLLFSDERVGSSFGKDQPVLKTNPDSTTPENRLLEIVSQKSGIQEISLIVSEYGYFPKNLVVTQGSVVKLWLTNLSQRTLCFISEEFQIYKQVRLQKLTTIDFKPNRPGRFRFYCPIHDLEGFIYVKEPAIQLPCQSQLIGPSVEAKPFLRR